MKRQNLKRENVGLLRLNIWKSKDAVLRIYNNKEEAKDQLCKETSIYN